MKAVFRFHIRPGVKQRHSCMCEEQWGQKDRALTTSPPQGPVCDLGQHHDVTQPWDLLSTTLTKHQHSLTEPLFTSCNNTISRMRQLNVLFVTVALRETLPHGNTAQVSVSTRAGLRQRLRQCSHHGLLLTSKPQLAAALSGDRIQGKQFAQET